MRNEAKNNRSLPAGRQGGFIQLIILIIIVLILMKYFGITISGVFDWFTSFFRSVLR